MTLILREVHEKKLTIADCDNILSNLLKYYEYYGNDFKIPKKIIGETIIDSESIYSMAVQKPFNERLIYLSALGKMTKLDGIFRTRNNVELDLNDYIYHINSNEIQPDIGVAHVFFTMLDKEPAHSLEIFENSDSTIEKEVSAIDVNANNIGKIRAHFLDFFDFDSSSKFIKSSKLRRISSWTETLDFIREHTKEIILANDCFTSMNKYPFNMAVSNQIIRIITQLDQLSMNIDSSGKMNEVAQEIHKTHFAKVGGDYSSEQLKFETDLYFNDECIKNIDCTWHGKIESEHDPIRIHFTWPKLKDKPIIIAYVGQKKTKK